MATQEVIRSISGEASGDLSANQYQLVVFDSSGQVALCGDGALPDGVLQNKPDAAGRACTVALPGSVTKMVASAAIIQGALVASTATGTIETAGTVADVIVGKTLQAAAGVGELVPVLFYGYGGLVAA